MSTDSGVWNIRHLKNILLPDPLDGHFANIGIEHILFRIIEDQFVSRVNEKLSE